MEILRTGVVLAIVVIWLAMATVNVLALGGRMRLPRVARFDRRSLLGLTGIYILGAVISALQLAPPESAEGVVVADAIALAGMIAFALVAMHSSPSPSRSG